MRWCSQAAACLVAIVLAGCSGHDRARDASTTTGGGAGTETGTMSDTGSRSGQPGMTSDTSSGLSADTGLKGMSGDTASGGEESGVADSGGTHAVPSKGDSLNSGVDSAR